MTQGDTILVHGLSFAAWLAEANRLLRSVGDRDLTAWEALFYRQAGYSPRHAASQVAEVDPTNR